jgi:hypothetical protein
MLRPWHFLPLRYVPFGLVALHRLTVGKIERVLTLLKHGEIDFKLVEEPEATGTKRKRRATKTSSWKQVQPHGQPSPFSDAYWGRPTRQYMRSLMKVPQSDMVNIVSEAKAIAGLHALHKTRTLAQSESEDSKSGRANLDFC